MPESLDWKILCLDFDEASHDIKDFLQTLWPDKITTYSFEPCAHNTRPEYAREIAKNAAAKLADTTGKILTVYGSGSYHQFTYGLLTAIADERSKSYTYIHIDQHSDNGAIYDPNIITCGNFVSFIPDSTHATAIKYIGCKSIFNPVPSQDRLHLASLEQNSQESLTKLFDETPDAAYITTDLDVLWEEQMATGYPGGMMNLSTLIETLLHIKKTKNIISADACGFHINHHIRENPKTTLRKASILVYAAIAGIFLGEDITEFTKEHKRLTKTF